MTNLRKDDYKILGEEAPELHLKLFRTACISLLRAPRKDGGKDGRKKHRTVCSFNYVVFLERQCDGIWCEGARYCCTPSCPT